MSNRILLWAICISVVITQVCVGLVVHENAEALQKEKTTSEFYRQEALRQNSLYEGALKDEAQLRKDLAEARKQAALSAKREEAARSRASRSRRAEPKRSVSSVASEGSFTGGLRDITMYCTGSITASGKVPHPGMVATISRRIPFGTRVSIEGLGTFVVEDRIGHGSEFDLFVSSCSEAKSFGRQHRRVTIL